MRIQQIILTKKMNISMKIMKSTGGCSWIKENLKKLENLNYYQNLSFAFGGAEKADDNCAASRAGQKKAQERGNTTEIVEKIYRKMTEYRRPDGEFLTRRRGCRSF